MATLLSAQSPTPNNATVKPKEESTENSSDSFEISRRSANQKKTKLVCRKIPLFVTEDEIKGHLEEFKSSYDWFCFCSQPKISKNPTRRNKRNYNRFYINFHSFDDAIPFIDKFRKLTFQKPQKEEDKKQDFYRQ